MLTIFIKRRNHKPMITNVLIGAPHVEGYLLTMKLQCKRLKKYQCPVPRHFVGQRTRTCTRHRAAHPANAADATNADAANAVWNLEGSMSLLETICINM